MRSGIIAIRAHLETEIDFADEGLKLPGRKEIAAEIARLADDIVLLHDSFRRGRITREGARATIVGKPNAGKSSVLNLMLGADRAIVTATPAVFLHPELGESNRLRSAEMVTNTKIRLSGVILARYRQN